MSTSGAGVEPAEPREASGLAPRCVPVPPAGHELLYWARKDETYPIDTAHVQTTVKVSKKAKQQLERLRAEVARIQGRRVSQRELVDHLIVRASHNPSAAAASLFPETDSMGPEEFREFLRKRKAWGIDDGSVDIDARIDGGGA